MNREIKFRGKDEYGNWCYGDLIRNFCVEGGDKITCGIIEDWDVIEVNPETVGQYIGKKDKNGKEIYKGDKVRCTVRGDARISVVTMGNGCWIGKRKGYAQDDGIFRIKDIEVIGNIYEEK